MQLVGHGQEVLDVPGLQLIHTRSVPVDIDNVIAATLPAGCT
jgi:hypothetical protein